MFIINIFHKIQKWDLVIKLEEKISMLVKMKKIENLINMGIHETDLKPGVQNNLQN